MTIDTWPHAAALDVLGAMWKQRDELKLTREQSEAILTAVGWGTYVRNKFKREGLAPGEPSIAEV